MVDRKRWRAMSCLSEAKFTVVPGCRHLSKYMQRHDHSVQGVKWYVVKTTPSRITYPLVVVIYITALHIGSVWGSVFKRNLSDCMELFYRVCEPANRLLAKIYLGMCVYVCMCVCKCVGVGVCICVYMCVCVCVGVGVWGCGCSSSLYQGTDYLFSHSSASGPFKFAFNCLVV